MILRICSGSMRSFPATRPRRPKISRAANCNGRRDGEAGALISEPRKAGRRHHALALMAPGLITFAPASRELKDDDTPSLQHHERADHRRLLRADGARLVAHP